MSELLQFLVSGITVGAIYAAIALGFTLIYNASGVVNFAQGEFVVIGGMTAAALIGAGVPVWIAAPLAVIAGMLVGVLLYRLAIRPAREAPLVSLIIITIGASIFLRGAMQAVFDKQIHRYDGFSGDAPLRVGGATILPQSLWIIGGSIAVFAFLAWFLNRTRAGRGIRATASNRMAAALVGINTGRAMNLSFALSAAIGALAGVLATPVTFTSYDVGVLMALKGFSATMLGGVGSPLGALAGGLLIGLIEAMTAGYISSDYKDASAFVVILLVLFLRPQGLFGARITERV
ncbi:amino acid/amide ABC transporter membrane protein 1 (HAAT family) [Limimaricola soesokkakensis]|uniref:Amino acid/amide ABC transporter membrane protein 1 (HAAT family) n=1 Tax=Limimaricola soesokkakensis TaxID=1343159 RepID=A0A1X6YX78_9RHOB|nr:branched-chain amino acid ABC transporter permease [Limimaricola soesokkakensis]PSK87720.1 amino acid/amide ABC transporter membrane protein 1 (HAAT family) [Limimaricola soesokkakensis]SLN33419.1 High-affinity branched-chain amino acid transport system permease protein LivH [Limimaricola soesokkakensis]